MRCGALRCATPTNVVEVTRSSAATGNPQQSRAAKLTASETTGAAGPALPGVTIGRTSPTTTSTAITQNLGLPASWLRPATPSLMSAQPRSTPPATVTEVISSQSGEPIRGPMSLVSFGSFMTVLTRGATAAAAS